MKYIIMADGKGARWNNYNNVPKHLIKIKGETLIARIVRLLKIYDPEGQIIITSHDKRYEVEGALRYEPRNNVLELDRFTTELIEDNICFLYGDTFYSESSIRQIVDTKTQELIFFGNNRSIVAVKVKEAKRFMVHMDHIRSLYTSGRIKECKGWQVYHSYAGLPLEGRAIGEKFVYINGDIYDLNSLDDYEKMIEEGVE